MSYLLSLIQILIAILLAAFAYYYAQRALEMNRGSFAFHAYLDCVRKVGAFDWSTVPGGKPGSASEICGRR